VPKIEDEYIKTGKLRYVVRDLPLESIHRNAFKAAEAAHCAGDQGKYWELHDRFFANQSKLSRQDLTSHAQAVGLDVAAFDRCVDSGKHTARVRKDVVEVQQAGGTGTPTFYLGLADPAGKTVKSARVIRGAQPFAAFKEAIDALLESPR
jgi:protein-disulfide isomerase